VVSKVQLSLVVPGMRDRILCELPLEKASEPDLIDHWELEEFWLGVSADGMRALAFERSNARAGEKPVGALVVFQAIDAREASSEERKQLQEACKAQKVQAKQRRAQRQAEKQAAHNAATAEASA
jgi:chromatin segregation and condensation protein Rec8/ScpA/Scc1 (kleisin family)